MTQTLVVIGLGYVGLPMALHGARAGFRTYGLDTNPGTVASLNAGKSHIGDVSDEEVSSGIAGAFEATSDPEVLAGADVILVCVPTPLADEGGPDLGPVRAAAETIGKHITPGTLAILESTTYPGTTEEVFVPLITSTGLLVGKDVFAAFSPERIDPGNRTYGVKNTPKVVGGISSECTRRAVDFYSNFVDTVIPAKGAREAEMSKLIENTFRHVNIALMNEMLRFSHDLGIDLWNAIDCAETKPFGYMAFRPGPGVGGHCIPVDPSYLSHRVKARLGYSFRMVELAEEINTAAPLYVASRVRDVLNDQQKAVKGSSVLLLGVTYKPNVADCRQSPADALAKQLIASGARVTYHDPYVPSWTPRGVDESLSSAADPYLAATEADVAVLLQAHRDYDFGRLAASAAHVLDTRAALPQEAHVTRM